MTPDEYRAMLWRAVEEPSRLAPLIGQRETDKVLTLAGNTVGLGARGELVGYNGDGQAIRLFTRAQARRMLAKLDAELAAGADDPDVGGLVPND